MKEPNLEGMIEYLSEIGNTLGQNKEDNISTIMMNNSRDISKEVQQIVYFACEERACSTQDEISRMSNKEKQKNVICALISLYPLTKSLVMELIKKADLTPSDFLEIYDVNCELLQNIKSNVELVKNSSKSSQVDVNNYANQIKKLQEDIDILEGERKGLEESIEGYKDKIEEKENLEKDIQELKRIKESGINKEIEQLEIDKGRLEAEKKEKQERKENLKEEIVKLKEELQRDVDGAPEGYQEALNCLQQCMEKLSK